MKTFGLDKYPDFFVLENKEQSVKRVEMRAFALTINFGSLHRANFSTFAFQNSQQYYHSNSFKNETLLVEYKLGWALYFKNKNVIKF